MGAVFLPLLGLVGIAIIFWIAWALKERGYTKHMYVFFMLLFAIGMVALAISSEAYACFGAAAFALLWAVYIGVKW